MPRSTHRCTRWPGQRTLQGLLALRVWMVLVVAMLGLGTGVRPSAAPTPASTRVAEQGLRSSPTGPVSPCELPEEQLPLRGDGEEGEDAKDAEDAEDFERRRAPASAVSLAPSLELQLIAAVAWQRYGAAQRLRSASAHRSQLHNRGPPLA